MKRIQAKHKTLTILDTEIFSKNYVKNRIFILIKEPKIFKKNRRKRKIKSKQQ